MKNYTSSVPVERTITRIEQILAKAHAKNIMKDYVGCEVVALTFTLPLSDTERLPLIRLPINVVAVEKVFLREKKRRLRPETARRIHEQAQRTAWKFMQDWIECQISLIELDQVEPLEIFLPHVWDGKQTYYDSLKAGGFKMLPEKGSKKQGD